MTERTDNRTLLAALLAGTIGAGLALLFAPRSGRETREKMRERADDIKLQAEEGVTAVRDSLDQSIQEAQDLKRRLTQAMTNTGKKAKQEMEELQDDRQRPTPVQSSVLSTWEEEV